MIQKALGRAALLGFFALPVAIPAQAQTYGQGINYNWSGVNVGGFVGGAWNKSKITDVDGYAGGAPAGTTTTDKSQGAFGGASLGYNFQTGRLVYGLEADIGYLGPKHSTDLTGSTSGTTVGLRSGVYGDITGRLGVAVGPALLYGKGGIAFLGGGDNFNTQSGSFSSTSNTNIYTGWTAGAGIEYAWSKNWSTKIEYQHFDFGKRDFTVFNAASVPFTFNQAVTSDTVKVGLNYRF
jgi:outer membrane immunogenic protein